MNLNIGLLNLVFINILKKFTMKSFQYSLFLMDEIKTLINQNLTREIEHLKKELEKAEKRNETLEDKLKEERIKSENERKHAEAKYENYQKYAETKYEKLFDQAKEERNQAKEERNQAATRYEKLLDQSKDERKNYFLKFIIIVLFILITSCHFGFN